MAMAIGSSSLDLTRTLHNSRFGILPARVIPSAQLAPSSFLCRTSLCCGGSLLKFPPRGQQEWRGRNSMKFRAALSQSVDAYRKVAAPNAENVDVKKLVQALEEACARGREDQRFGPLLKGIQVNDLHARTPPSWYLNGEGLRYYCNDLQPYEQQSYVVPVQVVMAAVDLPRNIDYKGATDLVTDTDRKTEEVILDVVRRYFPDHLILGEEGGVSGDPRSEYLWCIDPLDGTTNFAQNYPSFAVSIAVLHKGRPIAAAVVEFAGGPFIWDTRTFTASSGGGAFCNGRKIHVSIRDQVERSLFVTGFGYEHDDAWSANIDLFKEFTDKSRGVRRLGAAAVDMCHVALGIAEGYWEFRLKPWDMAAGVLIVEEAGGKVTRMDGGDFCVFERSVLVSNGVIHDKLVERIAPPTHTLIKDGFDLSQWYKPTGYVSEV